MEDRKRVCCNCGNNIRTGEITNIKCHCAIDGHYIGYTECFEVWCRRWKKERKWERMTDKLKPCPFCGGEARIRDLSIKIPYDGIAYFVECCQCEVRSGISFDGEQAAIEAWNTRKPMDRIVEQLKEYQRNYSSGLGGFTDELVNRVLRNAIEIVKAGGKGE